MCMYVYVHVCMYMYVCICVCMYMCMYVLRATQHDVESSSTYILTRTHLPLINYMLISMFWTCCGPVNEI